MARTIPSHALRLLPLAFLAVVLFSTNVPQVAAQTSDPTVWSDPVSLDAGLAVAASLETDTAGSTEKVGMVLRGASDAARFYLKADETSPWVVKNTDINGASAGFTQMDLTWAGGTTWVVSLQYNSIDEVHFHQSTDDGATWTDVETFTGVVDSPALRMAYADQNGLLGVAYKTSVQGLQFRQSTDAAATWDTAFSISDNNGAPTGTCGTSAQTNSATTADIEGGTGFDVWFGETTSNPDRVFRTTSGNGFFWDPPYDTNCGTVQRQADYSACSATVSTPSIRVRSGLTLIDTGVDQSGSRIFCMGNHEGGVCSACEPFAAWLVPSSGGARFDVNPDGHRILAADSGTDLKVYHQSGAGEAISLVHTAVNANPSGLDVVMTPTQAYVIYTDGDSGGELKETHATIFGAGDSVSSNQVLVTNLVGASMDNIGSVIAARTDDGTMVRSYPVSTLIESGAVATEDCEGRADGITTQSLDGEIYISYIECDEDNGDVNQLFVKDQNLGAPFFPTCASIAQEEVSEDDFLITESFELPAEMKEVGTLGDAPLNWAVCDTEGDNENFASWSFSTTDGRVGVYAVSIQDEGRNTDDVTTVLLNPAGPIDQFCNIVNADIFGAVADNGPTGIYQGFVSEVDGSTGDLVEATVLLKFKNTGVYANANGIACDITHTFIAKGDHLYALTGILNNSVALDWSKTVAGVTVERGVAASSDGNWVSWIEDIDGPTATQYVVAYASNGTETFRDAVPDHVGSFVGMEMDGTGEHIAFYHTGSITVVETSSVTCELTECGPASDDNGCEGTSTGCDPPGSSVDGGSGSGGTGPPGSSFLGNDAQNVEDALSVFADLGAILSQAVLGILPLWAILLTALLGAVVVVLRLKGG
jgi:hypothetical protein